MCGGGHLYGDLCYRLSAKKTFLISSRNRHEALDCFCVCVCVCPAVFNIVL